ncbi:transposase [Streptomyces sp. NPDC050560]|uniref:transposase n=1 Tax=Streptomyces sp. NPDC050560 TaxID=3365630 RepID=UPI003799C5A9
MRGRGKWSWIVPDGLWEIAEPLIPPSKARPQGGGTPDTPDETLFAAIIYVLVSGCAWRALPPCFGISKPTAHRRFLMHVLSDANGLPLLVGVSVGNTHDSEGPKPMVEGHQTRHDPHRGRHFKPQRLHADKAYDRADLRKWLRGKRIGVRIARKGIESSERLGRRRWVIERTMSWLSGYRRLSPRYERDPRNYLAFLGLAAALCCYKRLLRLTT